MLWQAVMRPKTVNDTRNSETLLHKIFLPVFVGIYGDLSPRVQWAILRMSPTLTCKVNVEATVRAG